MRLALAIVVALCIAACGSGIAPASPSPTPPAALTPPAPPARGLLWTIVFPEGERDCIKGATVQVIVDGTVVQSGTQTECNYWGDTFVLFFFDLPTSEVTLRASAEGYVTREIKVTPTNVVRDYLRIDLQRAN